MDIDRGVLGFLCLGRTCQGAPPSRSAPAASSRGASSTQGVGAGAGVGRGGDSSSRGGGRGRGGGKRGGGAGRGASSDRNVVEETPVLAGSGGGRSSSFDETPVGGGGGAEDSPVGPRGRGRGKRAGPPATRSVVRESEDQFPVQYMDQGTYHNGENEEDEFNEDGVAGRYGAAPRFVCFLHVGTGFCFCAFSFLFSP